MLYEHSISSDTKCVVNIEQNNVSRKSYVLRLSENTGLPLLPSSSTGSGDPGHGNRRSMRIE